VYVQGRRPELLKKLEIVDAKKSALGMLSPFQVNDFQFAYAKA